MPNINHESCFYHCWHNLDGLMSMPTLTILFWGACHSHTVLYNSEACVVTCVSALSEPIMQVMVFVTVGDEARFKFDDDSELVRSFPCLYLNVLDWYFFLCTADHVVTDLVVSWTKSWNFLFTWRVKCTQTLSGKVAVWRKVDWKQNTWPTFIRRLDFQGYLEKRLTTRLGRHYFWPSGAGYVVSNAITSSIRPHWYVQSHVHDGC